IRQHVGATGIQVEIQLPAAAELEQIQAQAPPDEKTLMVLDEGLKTTIRHVIEPGVQLRPKVAQDPHHGFAEVQDRPWRRRRSWTWLRTSCRLSCEISWIKPLRRWYSSIHERTSSVKSTGTWTEQVLPCSLKVN